MSGMGLKGTSDTVLDQELVVVHDKKSVNNDSKVEVFELLPTVASGSVFLVELKPIPMSVREAQMG